MLDDGLDRLVSDAALRPGHHANTFEPSVRRLDGVQRQFRVLGLRETRTKTARIERPDELKRKIDEAAKYLPVEQLAISPQCGFSSNVWGPPMTEDDQWRKLDVLMQVASDVWGRVAA